jgi:ATP-dependent helicase HrpA
LPELPRFLKAIKIRRHKLHNAGLKRDLQAMGVVRPLWQRWKALPENADPAIRRDVRWLIEELRVSLFAQELKTSVKVSPERVEKWLGMMEPVGKGR